MKVLMLGWEFPPYIAGGLGTACYGLTKALNGAGVDVLFVLPKAVEEAKVGRGLPVESYVALAGPHYEFEGGRSAVVEAQEKRAWLENEKKPAATAKAASIAATSAPTALAQHAFEHVSFRTLDVMLNPYMTARQYQRLVEKKSSSQVQPAMTAGQSGDTSLSSVTTTAQAQPFPVPQASQPQTRGSVLSPTAGKQPAYGGDLFAETQRYANLVTAIAKTESFDLIHAHDWMTFRAALAVAKLTGKPLVIHVHSTEYDRAGQHVNPLVVEIERAGMMGADQIIVVSHLTKRMLIARYGVPEEKIVVIHNAVDLEEIATVETPARQGGDGKNPSWSTSIKKDEKIVLFVGRVTYQKGPEYFLAAARKVLSVYPKVKFVIAGAGDLMPRMIELAAAMDMGQKVLFTGFLRSKDVERVYQMADVYVMPSVSEPFGIAPLEAMAHEVPVIVSKQSGVSEVIKHALKVDFWDTDELANKIVGVLKHPPLGQNLRKHGAMELKRMTWEEAAKRVLEVYGQLETVGLAV